MQKKRMPLIMLSCSGVLGIVASAILPAPHWVAIGLAIIGIFLLSAASWVGASSNGERAEWIRLTTGVFMAALLGFVLSSALSVREEDRVHRAVTETLRATALQELQETTARLSQEITWTLTPLGADSPVSLVDLTYLSSAGLRQAVLSGRLPGSESERMQKLANNIDLYNTIVRFALDAGSAALHEPALAGLLQTTKENLDQLRSTIVRQSTDLQQRLSGGNE